MTALRCPCCGLSDLHAVEVDVMEVSPEAPGMIKVEHQTELACKQCGWTPTAQTHPHTVLEVKSIDSNV